jgi:hypothetical protein
MDYMTTIPRTLVNVQRELSVALQHKTRDMRKIGSLLNEVRPRRERPCCHAAKPRNELSPPH